MSRWLKCAGYLALGVGIYAGLYLALGGNIMLPFGVGWSVFLIWACAHVGGYAATQVCHRPLPACPVPWPVSMSWAACFYCYDQPVGFAVAFCVWRRICCGEPSPS